MIYLGLDYGSKRIGLAVSDETALIADPEGILTYDSPEKLWSALLKAIGDTRANAIVVGIPKRTTGEDGVEAKKVFKFVEELKSKTTLPVATWDERFTTVEANRLMREVDLTIKQKKEKRDAIAAKIMLQSYLDFKRIGNSCTN